MKLHAMSPFLPIGTLLRMYPADFSHWYSVIISINYERQNPKIPPPPQDPHTLMYVPCIISKNKYDGSYFAWIISYDTLGFTTGKSSGPDWSEHISPLNLGIEVRDRVGEIWSMGGIPQERRFSTVSSKDGGYHEARTWAQPLGKYGVHKEVLSANSLNELESIFFPKASRRQLSQGAILTSAVWKPKQRTHSHPVGLWDSKWELF